MNSKKNIDRLFQEKFKDFERTPDDAVWSKIEAKLNEKKKRRVIPIWWRYAGVAALFLITLTLGNLFFNPKETNTTANPTNQVVDIKDNDNSTRIIESTVTDTNTTNDLLNKKLQQQNKEENIIANIESKNNKTENQAASIGKEKTNLSKANQSTVIVNSVTNQKNSNSSLNKSKVLEDKKSKDNTQIAASNFDDIKPINSQKTDALANNSIDTSKIKSIVSKDPQNAIADKNSTETEEGSKIDDLVNNDVKKETESIEEAIAKNENIIEEEEGKLNRWSIAPNAAPVYFNTLGEGSSIASQFNGNNKTGEINMSYGINASYVINKKLIVRSGVNRVNLGYNTNNVAVFESINSVSFNTISSIRGDNNVTEELKADVPSNDNIKTDVSLVSNESLKSSKIAPESFSKASNANINQSLGFIEIPLEFQYIISDKKLGLNVIGGFSSFFLNNNEIFSETSSSRTLIGEAVNVNKISYSANFGLGLNYKITKKINLNFEPMFKYQINTFNNTSGDFKPYFIGIYTGFGIKF